MWNKALRIKERYTILFVVLTCLTLVIVCRKYWKDENMPRHRSFQLNDDVVVADNININKSPLDTADLRLDEYFLPNRSVQNVNDLHWKSFSLPIYYKQQATKTSKSKSSRTTTPSYVYAKKERFLEDTQELSDTGQEVENRRHKTKKSTSPFDFVNLLHEKTPGEPFASSQKTSYTSNETLYRVHETLLRKALNKMDVKLPAQPRRVRGPWQMVEAEHEIYLLSAYYDDRPTLDQPRVTVIAIAEPAAKELFCLFWYDEQNQPEVRRVEVISVGPQMAPGGVTWYEQYLFSCSLPAAQPARPPVNVSIITSHNIRPSTNMQVKIPLKPSSPKKVLEFGHCMSILYWKQDPYKIVEWLELHRMWGVSEVNIYGHELDNHTESVLKHYESEGFVRYQTIPTVIDEPNELAILLNMSPVLNDCLYRNMYRYKYIVCTDIDEMIVPRGTSRTYFAMLKAIDKSRSSEGILHQPLYSYLFRNAYFFLDFGPVYDSPWWSLTLRYTRRIEPSKYGYSSKSITRSMDCIGLQNHLCWRPAHKSAAGDKWNYDVSITHGLNHHYKKCHFDQYLGKDGECLKLLMQPNDDVSLKRFREQLFRSVIAKLKKLDLVEETHS